jgi:protein dithiol oxidoreductase (disulfide-forming)
MRRALAVALIAIAAVSIVGCSKDAQSPPPAASTPAPSSSSTSTPPRSSVVPAPPRAIGQWMGGKHFVELLPAQPTNVSAGKIEVLEVFWYGCPHCYSLDPVLESWKTSGKPADVEFARVHVMWGQGHKQQAHLYYTLQALNRPDLHRKAFDTIQGGKYLVAAADADARMVQAKWAEQQGVPEKTFLDAYDSMVVAMNLQRAEDITRRFAIQTVPTIIVNGKFTTDIDDAGGTTQLLNVIADLAASERR